MANIRVVVKEDLPLITKWLGADPWHKDESRNNPEALLTGKGLLCFCLEDDEGPLCFCRLDAQADMIRVAVQFGPPAEISKRRLVLGMNKTFFPVIKNFAVMQKSRGLVYESVSPTLIAFCEKHGFEAVGGDDYAWLTGDIEHV